MNWRRVDDVSARASKAKISISARRLRTTRFKAKAMMDDSKALLQRLESPSKNDRRADLPDVTYTVPGSPRKYFQNRDGSLLVV